MAELRKGRRAGVGIVAVASVLLLTTESAAQLHWDASAQAGVNKRFASDAADPGFGPVAQLNGHVALLPLVRVGGYFGHEMSPVDVDAPWRQITFGGLRVKGMLPWVRGSARAWIFTGFGYARTYAPSYQYVWPVSNATARVQGAGGGFFDIPFGLGASYTFFKPWALCAELGGRFGFGHTGKVYEKPDPQTLLNLTRYSRTDGLDRFALGLTVGILVEF